jgi:hypothetical protein
MSKSKAYKNTTLGAMLCSSVLRRSSLETLRGMREANKKLMAKIITAGISFELNFRVKKKTKPLKNVTIAKIIIDFINDIIHKG